MSITFYIPGYLRNFTSGRGEVELQTPAGTVGELLKSLRAAHPALRDRIVTEQGLVREHLNIFVGSESIRFTGGLSTAVGDGSEITIVPAVSGGVE
jgi:molybdopterin synthase sulfur carrier subunit